MKTSYLFFIPILSVLNIAVAQAQNLIGKIVNEANGPVEFANVLLFALPDSAFQTGSVSGADGRFQLSSELSNGLLKVSCIGYTTLYKTYAVGDELLLQLTPDTQILDEIVVKGFFFSFYDLHFQSLTLYDITSFRLFQAHAPVRTKKRLPRGSRALPDLSHACPTFMTTKQMTEQTRMKAKRPRVTFLRVLSLPFSLFLP